MTEADTREADEPKQVDAKVEAEADASERGGELPPEFDEENAFPRMVFRKGTTAKVFGAFDVDFLVVGNKTALRNALDHGWHLDPAKTAEADPKGKGKAGKEGREGEEAGMGEEPYNPRPNEPDNAPFQNTGYVEHQTGDAQPASPPDPPVMEPIPPEEGLEKPPPGTDPPLGGSREADEEGEENGNGKRGRGRPRSK
jgi:hypothetical protein